MRLIELLELTEPKFSHREALISLLTRPKDPRAGINYHEMSVVIPIINKIEKAEGVLYLEESEWKEVCDRIKKVPFAQASQEIFDFINGVLEAEKVTLSAVKEGKAV